jgi:hypothetical protein
MHGIQRGQKDISEPNTFLPGDMSRDSPLFDFPAVAPPPFLTFNHNYVESDLAQEGRAQHPYN